MNSVLCHRLGIEFPLFAFTHCRDVVAAVTNAGGFGVLGAVGHTPESLEIELNWIDEHVDGKPYGVDLLVPNVMESKDDAVSATELEARIPPEHREYVENLLKKHGLDTRGLWQQDMGDLSGNNMRASGATAILDVAFKHPIKLVVNALGPPPPYMVERARAAGISVGALAGAKEHALKHVQSGADIIIASGTEAGGHCGEISTMVLVPEILRALEPYGDKTCVLAAGGIVTGRQMAACMAMGAAGAWTGSVWLTTVEAETTPVVKEKMLAATSRNTARSRSRTGKPTRQLQSAWTDAWGAAESLAPLPMPLQGMLSKPAFAQIDKMAANGHEGARELASYYVGQGVGLLETSQSARSVVYDFMEDFAAAVERLNGTVAQ